MRRRRLHVRQSLAYRSGKHPDPNWSVGYWDDKPKANADEAFRSFGGFPTEAEAAEFAKGIAERRKKEFIF